MEELAGVLEEINRLFEQIDLDIREGETEPEPAGCGFELEPSYTWHDYWPCNLKTEGQADSKRRPVQTRSRGPAFFQVKRVPRYQLGYRVLGCAFPTKGLALVASGLYGEEYEEVKLHEMLHLMYPHLSELEIRAKTRAMLPFEPKFD